MVASELAFMVLGGVLGVLAGAALIVILRTRPPAPRQIRLIMTPGSVPIRTASTLAGDPFAVDVGRVARGGPADMDWHRNGRLALASADGNRPRNGTSGRSAGPMATPVSPSPAVETSPAEPPPVPPDPAVDPPSTTDVSASVGLAIDSGADPVLAAITASGGRRSGGRARPHVDDPSATGATEPEAGLGEEVGVPVLVGRPGRPVALAESAVGSGVAVLEAAMRARRGGATAADVAGSIAVMASSGPRRVGAGPRPATRMGRGSPSGGPGGGPGGRGQGSPSGVYPCAEIRHTVDERCALAERMRLTAERAADALREAQHTYDVHVSQADSAAAIADARAQRAAKDEAQNAFRTERGRAGSREEVEAAAREWLQEINRVNASAREAAATLAREREAAAALQPVIERLTIEADAGRVQAEAAGESCLMAREALATCEEALHTDPPPRAAPEAGPFDGPGGEAPIPVGAVVRHGSTLGPIAADEDGALAVAVREGDHPAILRLLTGDRTVMHRLIVALAGDDPVDQRRWQIQLADLIDAIVSRAIEACAFVFPDDHPFWGPFDRTQGRDIALALSSLGFRFDGMGGFADERVPSQRDLSLALGYAGLDPMRVRRWPTEAEMVDLYRDVTVAADEYITGAAAGLTLGELVGLLGRRADALTEVWNAWGRIRPILLQAD